MNILDRILSYRRQREVQIQKPPASAELIRLQELNGIMSSFLSCNHYVARSEYRDILNSASDLPGFFNVLRRSEMLKTYCRKNNITVSEISHILSRYKRFDSLIEAKNEKFVQSSLETEKEYLDHILYECDPAIRLDEDQRRVVLTDEDYCLVVAGAGAGKTTTVAAKVKYLVDKRKIDPKDILVISFTNKAVNELRQRINKELQIDCPVTTFHSAGNAILHIHSDEKRNIVDDGRLYYVIQDYFRNTVFRKEKVIDNLILFFGSYFDAPYEGDDLNAFFHHMARTSFTTMRSELDDYSRQILDRKSNKPVTIQNEILRSHQEVEIANFLYLNGIDYEYEPLYPYDVPSAKKPYTPDFLITQGERSVYLEHFGITEDGRNSRYTEEQLETYKKTVNQKVILHRSHGTTLIYTFSSYRDNRTMTDHLRDQLLEKGFVLNPRSGREIIEKLAASESSRYIRKLVVLICRFISNFKVNGYTIQDFSRMSESTQNVRTRLFLDICRDCYLEYDRFLKEHEAVDFQDMINESARLLREVKEMKERLHFKYIIVDEYQDISRQRFDLITALHEVTDAKILAVGDDWQSIYAFSGSDITLFTKFKEKMGYASLLKIVRTYRNSQEVIDIAGNFIQKNRSQIEKDLISGRHLQDPVIIYTYESMRNYRPGDYRTGVNYAIARAIETALEQIIKYNRMEGKKDNGTVLLLGRFCFDGDRLEKSGLFEYTARGSRLRSVTYPDLDITFMTAHSSKGLGYDNVIVINGKNETYGFPAKIEDDPVLSFVTKEDRSIKYAEERRLFYVAMTRTKNRVYCIAPEENPSEFLLEIKKDYKNVSLKGKWSENQAAAPAFQKACPMCGYPLQLRYKASYGLRLYICTNEPEICGFMTNEVKAGKLSILKCDSCRDGYLVVKPGNDRKSYILGCTNYKKDGTGCRRVMSAKYYYDYMHITDTEPVKPVIQSTGKDIRPKSRILIEQDAKNGKEIISEETLKKGQVIMPEQKEKQKPEQKPESDHSTEREVLYKDIDLCEAVPQILRCLSAISQKHFYRGEILADVLTGSVQKKEKAAGLEKAEGFGSLTALDRREILYIIDYLIKKEYIRKTNGLRPVLHPTYKGIHYEETLRRRQVLWLRRNLQQLNID